MHRSVSAPVMIDPIQRFAARMVGFLYLFTMASGIFAVYVRGPMIVYGDAARTAASSLAAEPMFRLAILADLVTIAGVLGLVAGLYIVLASVNRYWALVGLVFRLAESGVFASAILGYVAFLTLLSGAPFLASLSSSPLQALAYAALRVHDASSNIGFMFLGLGSSVFAWLWLKSRFIPKLIAVWGIVASLLMATVSMVGIVLPALTTSLGLLYMFPLAVFEIGIGAWLLIRGLREPTLAT